VVLLCLLVNTRKKMRKKMSPSVKVGRSLDLRSGDLRSGESPPMARPRSSFLLFVFVLSHALFVLGGKNYYDVLQVPKGASDEQIKRAYRKLALKYHRQRRIEAACWQRSGTVKVAGICSQSDRFSN